MEPHPIKPIQIEGSASRVRLSNQVISRLGWNDFDSDFICYALLRKQGEILCSPLDINTENGEHPFQTAIDIVDTLHPLPVPELQDIPSTSILLASQRLSKFEAHWTSTARKQIDLKLGKDMTQYLRRGKSHKVFPICWGKILILLSETEFLESLQTDFTGGDLNLS